MYYTPTYEEVLADYTILYETDGYHKELVPTGEYIMFWIEDEEPTAPSYVDHTCPFVPYKELYPNLREFLAKTAGIEYDEATGKYEFVNYLEDYAY